MAWTADVQPLAPHCPHLEQGKAYYDAKSSVGNSSVGIWHLRGKWLRLAQASERIGRAGGLVVSSDAAGGGARARGGDCDPAPPGGGALRDGRCGREVKPRGRRSPASNKTPKPQKMRCAPSSVTICTILAGSPDFCSTEATEQTQRYPAWAIFCSPRNA